MKYILALFVALISHISLAISADAPPPFVEKLATPAHIKLLHAGGYVLYFRHGNTDNSRPDRTPTVDLNDCLTQRPLSEEGRNLMKVVGKGMLKAKISVSEIFVSPMCRAQDTARAVFAGAKLTTDNLLINAANMTTEEKKPLLDKTRSMISTPVTSGKNRAVVGHAPILIDMMGYFPKEGTCVIFKPLGDNQYEYIASIPPQHWQKVLP